MPEESFDRLLCVIGGAERGAVVGMRPWIVAMYEDGILLAVRSWRDVLSGWTILEGGDALANDPALLEYKRAELWDRCSRRKELLGKHRANRLIPAVEIAEATLRQSGRGKLRLRLRLRDGATIKMEWKGRGFAADENPSAEEALASLRTLLGDRPRFSFEGFG
jgi:hypothetical protein